MIAFVVSFLVFAGTAAVLAPVAARRPRRLAASGCGTCAEHRAGRCDARAELGAHTGREV
jgi:hypothetical protein